MGRWLCSFLTVCLALAPPAQAKWWRGDYKARRSVTLPSAESTGLPGDDIAVVHFPTGGLVLPDGRDIRVIADKGGDVARRVLMVGPGDRASVAFAVTPGVTQYHIYFGNPTPRDDGPPLTIQRGVLQETWAFSLGNLRTLEQARKILGESDELVGRGFRTRIFQGHNPFGPQTRLASTYTAWFMAPRTGEYVFCSSSQDASFLLIDGELVVDNGGLHGPQDRPVKQGRIRLTKGLHQLTYYHVNTQGNPIVVAAWQAPGGKRIWPMASADFAPVTLGQVGALEEYGRRATIDFIPEHLGEAYLAGQYLQRYRFRALATGETRSNVRWRWSFGDGVTAIGRQVEHVYLAPGEYEVTLTAEAPGNDRTRTMRLAVYRPWDLVTRTQMLSLADVAEVAQTYDWEDLQTEPLAWAMVLFDRTDDVAMLLAAGEQFVDRTPLPGALTLLAAEPYIDALLARGRAARAVDVLRAVSGATDSDGAAAMLLARAGQVTLDELGDTPGARELFEQVLARYGKEPNYAGVRWTQRGLGDVWREQGQFAKARSAYKASEPARKLRPGQQSFEAGGYARHAEYYLRTGDLDAAESSLRRWAEALPTDKLDGTWSLLTVQLRMLQKQFGQAAREAEVLVAVNPTSPQGPVILMLAANAYHRLNQPDEVARILGLIVKQYPESDLAAEAAKRLRQR